MTRRKTQLPIANKNRSTSYDASTRAIVSIWTHAVYLPEIHNATTEYYTAFHACGGVVTGGHLRAVRMIGTAMWVTGHKVLTGYQASQFTCFDKRKKTHADLLDKRARLWKHG